MYHSSQGKQKPAHQMRGINMSEKTSQTYRWQDSGDSGKQEPNDALTNKKIIVSD
jgi:hypothetical protein